MDLPSPVSKAILRPMTYGSRNEHEQQVNKQECYSLSDVPVPSNRVKGDVGKMSNSCKCRSQDTNIYVRCLIIIAFGGTFHNKNTPRVIWNLDAVKGFMVLNFGLLFNVIW